MTLSDSNTAKSIVLYGAGQSLPFFHRYAQRGGYTVVGICDSDPQKHGSRILGLVIRPLTECLEQFPDCYFLISVVNVEAYRTIQKLLLEGGIDSSRILSTTIDPDSLRDLCAEFHMYAMDDYFNAAEQDAQLQVFWGEETPFNRMFGQLDLDMVIELACGRGRHLPKYLEQAGNVTLVDILEKNIQLCKERFGANPKISYYTNSGSDLSSLPDSSYTALFTYDAMVHFESIDVYHYLLETFRVLKVGGRALFHHSNNTHDYKQSFIQSISGGRNYMSAQLFAHYANRAGFTVVEQQIIDWGFPELDCITLVEK